MVLLERVLQVVLSLLPLSGDNPHYHDSPTTDTRGLSVAIVGGGTGGVGVLKALFDLPEHVRKGWTIDLYEQRRDVGGVWLPDPSPSQPSRILPETPLYPRLRTNTPHPTSMSYFTWNLTAKLTTALLPQVTYPHFPFPPLTPLYPSHTYIQEYHTNYLHANNLTSYIHLNHSILAASYDETSHWNLNIVANDTTAFNRTYDHLIVASGHNHYPHEPTWPGEAEWLSVTNGQREVLHSIYYREPSDYAGRTVVVVGFGASGNDIAEQIVPYANKVYHSFSTDTKQPIKRKPIPGTVPVPRISHFTRDTIVFQDGSTVETPADTLILLATGYELLVPFLKPLHVATELDPSQGPDTATVTTNRRYIRPLHQQIFAIDAGLPRNALAFIGLPVWIANAPSDYAQGLFVAHGIASEDFLPSKADLLSELKAYENDVRNNGSEPFYIGHRFATEGTAEDYQDNLITLVRQRSRIPLPSFLENSSVPYVEPWRRRARSKAAFMRNGWLRAEAEGIDRQFLEGAVTESDWVEVMHRVEAWEEEQERRDVDLSSVLRGL